jgi:hypothetical protein
MLSLSKDAGEGSSASAAKTAMSGGCGFAQFPHARSNDDALPKACFPVICITLGMERDRDSSKRAP